MGITFEEFKAGLNKRERRRELRVGLHERRSAVDTILAVTRSMPASEHRPPDLLDTPDERASPRRVLKRYRHV